MLGKERTASYAGSQEGRGGGGGEGELPYKKDGGARRRLSKVRLMGRPMWIARGRRTFSRDFVARASTSRTKNYVSLAKTFSPGILVRSTCYVSVAKTFSPGILVRSTCGKSMLVVPFTG